MSTPFTTRQALKSYPLWDVMKERRIPITFDIEITARCNNRCRHCYINLPAGDRRAEDAELTAGEIVHIAEQAKNLGALWCLITGGEPLLRKDFPEIYQQIRNMGILTSVFTNACLITEEHIELFREYPPRDIEVTVYGATKETYERVTRRKGSYHAFRRGLDLLLQNDIRVRLKAMVIRSNIHELPEISAFCRHYTKDMYRFDPVLHKRYDRDPGRNREIEEERLTAEEVVRVEQADTERSMALIRNCDELIRPALHSNENHLF
ncbi:MAG: radical SAM protein, partial [Methanoregulaceae archaeon]|nr:radical SAM protein [Methanoregulaceae archaeon]